MDHVEPGQTVLDILPNETVEEFYKSIIHAKTHENAGYDLYLSEDIVIEPGTSGMLKFGVRCRSFLKDIDGTICQVSYLLLPRSSISKRGLIMLNSVGLIDSGYRGEIMAPVFNLTKDPVALKKGERLFQLLSMNCGKPFSEVNIVKSLDETVRGEGGFGSTGV